MRRAILVSAIVSAFVLAVLSLAQLSHRISGLDRGEDLLQKRLQALERRTHGVAILFCPGEEPVPLDRQGLGLTLLVRCVELRDTSKPAELSVEFTNPYSIALPKAAALLHFGPDIDSSSADQRTAFEVPALPPGGSMVLSIKMHAQEGIPFDHFALLFDDKSDRPRR